MTPVWRLKAANIKLTLTAGTTAVFLTVAVLRSTIRIIDDFKKPKHVVGGPMTAARVLAPNDVTSNDMERLGGHLYLGQCSDLRTR